MRFRLMQDDDGGMDSTAEIGQAGSSCFGFAKDSSNIFVVGTEEGDIYKCSTSYTTEYIASYAGHDMNVIAHTHSNLRHNVIRRDITARLLDHRSIPWSTTTTMDRYF